MASDTMGKKGFYRYIISKVKSKENVCLPLNGAGKLVKKDTVNVFTAFFSSVFTSKTGFQDFQAPETSEKVWSKENSPPVEEDQVRECLNKLNRHTFM